MRTERLTIAQAVANAERDDFRLTSDAPKATKKRAKEKFKRDPAVQRARKEAGKLGEKIASQLHAICLAAGVADVMKIATPMQILGGIKEGKRFFYKCVHAKASGCDYRGHMLANGVAVYVEVKAVTDPTERFPISHVREAQREQLEDGVRAGCVCVLVVIRAGHVYALPWSEARRHVSLGDRELRDWYVRPGTAYLSRWSEAE